VITSSLRNDVPFVFTAPAVMAYGQLPGDVMAPSTSTPFASLPWFPAAATVTTPRRQARSIAWHTGSSRHESCGNEPSDRLMTSI
jgi:hypothetical protein